MLRLGKRNKAVAEDGPAVEVSEKLGIRSLHLGSDAIQSSMRIKDPIELVLGYSRCMFAFLLFRAVPHEAVVIGLGGGSLPKFIHHHLPDTRCVALELYPQVLAVARSLFHLPEDDERLQVIVGDGAAYVREMTSAVDVIFHDAYGPTGIAEPLATEAFFATCRDRLTPEGVLVVNLWGSSARFDSDVARLSNVFEGRVLCLPARQKGNVVALCFKHGCNEPSWDTLKDRAATLETRLPLEFREFVSDLARMNPHNGRRLLI
jgi:spermidine synthase